MENGIAPLHPNQRASASRVLATRQAPALPAPPRQPFRVLQTRSAPAQLSLFLRPGPG